ncbi:hypothetical protein G9A89_014302 [Geosiphon pyriformis]|nr:hypothetical protein G9A89_014302 [Geosiphon pyriformis]
MPTEVDSSEKKILPESIIRVAKSDNAEKTSIAPKSKKKNLENPWKIFTSLNRLQALTFLCAWLGWTLDAFDSTLITYALPYIAKEFDLKPSVIASSITVTVFLRPVGAFLSGVAAEKYGRKWPFMINILLFSILEIGSSFAPNFQVFLLIRLIFGLALGGEWGLSVTLAMENIPSESRGLFSGILQIGYTAGLFFGAMLYYLAIEPLGWRAMFWIGSIPAILVAFARIWVPESPLWRQQRDARRASGKTWLNETKYLIKNYWGRFFFGILLMGTYNLPRGYYDLYPTFLKLQMGYNPEQIFIISILSAIGAVLGGAAFSYLSQYLGRKRIIIFASILSVAFLPLTCITSLNLPTMAFGSFCVYFFSDGYWSVVAAYLSELAPPSVRSVYLGLVPHIGSILGAYSAQVEALFAEKFAFRDGTPNYAPVQAILLVIAAVLRLVVVAFGKENKDIDFEEQVILESNYYKKSQDDGNKKAVVATL